MKNLLIIFGGKSSEYEVSLNSGASVIKNVPKDKYNITMLGITKSGEWRRYTGDIDYIENDRWNRDEFTAPAVLSSNPSDSALIVFEKSGVEKIKIDVIFPVLHGKNGEDGTIQGLFEMCAIPYVGCGVLSSSVCMDKAMTNALSDYNNIRQAKWRLVKKHDFLLGAVDYKSIIEALSFPIFVKPANAGSSVGITKASDEKALKEALKTAFEQDSKAVLEETVVGHELECAVLGNDDPIASCVGEVIPCNEFYDYEAKYIDGDSKLLIPAPVSKEKSDEIRKTAVKVYKALDCSGLSRVDFFMTDSGDVYFNEINTIPGFTSISMYSKLFEASGIKYGKLVEKLIDYAFEKEEK